MTIKQYGGVFGRNPTFNDVTIEGQLTFDGDIDINSDLKVSGDIETTGNVIIATSGKGIDFSATAGPNPPASGTSELFDDYEEGVWTPTDASGAGLTLTSYGNYTKIGRTVFWQAYVLYPATADASVAAIGGLPFALVTGANVSGRSGSTITVTTETTTIQSLQIETSDSVRFYKAGFVQNTNSELSGDEIYFSGFYITA
jgi:hypothetical protein